MSIAKAYSYIRMSTEVQLKGDSLRRQKEASAAYATSHDLDLVEDFELEDIGRSAFTGQHVAQGAFGLFLRKVQAGEIDKGSYLIVESLDRMSREIIESAALQFLNILQAGVNIVTLSDNHVYVAGKTEFTDIIYSIVVMSRAHEESKTKSLRVGAAWGNKRKKLTEQKLTKVAPVWLELDEERRQFHLIPEKAEVVRWIFDQADAGWGSHHITRALNLSDKQPIGKSNGWHESFVTKILTNRAAIGEFQPHHYVAGKRVPIGDPVLDYFPAAITRDQFERIQFGRSARRLKGAGRKGLNYRNLFSGIAKCGDCNGRMMFVDKGDGPKGGLYLRCDNSRRGNNCHAGSWPLKHFETAFFHYVKELDLHSLFAVDGIGEERKRVDEQSVAIQVERSALIAARDRAFELLVDGNVSNDYIDTKIRELSEKIAILDQSLAMLAVRGTELVARSSVSDLEAALLIENVRNFSDEDTRSKIANWLRMNVRELILYPNGLDGMDWGLPNRTLSVRFENGVFRTVTVDADNPTNHTFSVREDETGWSEEPPEETLQITRLNREN